MQAPQTPGRAPRPAYTADEAKLGGSQPQKNQQNHDPPHQTEAQTKAYWVYWAVCFSTSITWMFAVAAATDNAWIEQNGYPFLKLGEVCLLTHCNYYDAGTALQFTATILVSIVVVMIAVASFMQAPACERLGIASGIMLIIFSVLELAAFSTMAAFAGQLNSDDFKIESGPTVGVAVMAWLFGLAGGIAILLLRQHVTTGLPGPLSWCTQRQGAGLSLPPPPRPHAAA